MNSSPHILIASPRLEKLARRVVSSCPAISLQNVDWLSFPDQWPNTSVRQASDLERAHVTFLASLDVPSVAFEQLCTMVQLAKIPHLSYKIVLPYYAVGTMERIDYIGQVPTAARLADFISVVPPAGPGPIPLHIFDIHALATRDFFGANIVPVFRSGVKMLRDCYAGQDISIVFPDDGARKRFETMFRVDENDPGKGHVFPLVVCEKKRDGAARKVRIVSGEAKGRRCVVIDDIAHSGGTQLKCIEALREAGASEISAYVTHPVFDDGSEEGFMDLGLKEFVIGDTVPKAYELDGKGPFRVLSIAPKLVESIMK